MVTTFKTTTAPLSEVFFPAVVLCNINQIRGSIFKRLGIGSNATVINLLFEEFYIGRYVKILTTYNTSYLTDSYISFTLKMESVSKNTIFGLKMMVRSGVEKIILKSLHAGR